MRLSLALALAMLLGACPAADTSADAYATSSDVWVDPDAAVPPDAPADAGPDESAESICPRYDEHARECFGEMTGEDFLAECSSLYERCGGTLPAVVRCRLESECAALGSCTGMGC